MNDDNSTISQSLPTSNVGEIEISSEIPLDSEEDEAIIYDMPTKSDHIASAKRLMEVLHTIDELIEEDPTVAGRIRAFLDADDDGPPVIDESTGKMSNFDRVARATRDGKWRTVNRISSLSKVKINSVRDVIYRSYPEKFDKRNRPGTKRQSQFRLIEDEKEMNEDVE